jgi:HSP20 family protein
MYAMSKAVDRMLDTYGTQKWDEPQSYSLALDMVETKDEFTVRASLPGVKPDDLEITCNNNVLTIKAELKSEEESKERSYHLRERRYGVFIRSVALPETVTSEQIKADFENGVLTLHLPKAEEAQPRRIPVQTSGKLLDAKTTR